MIENAALKARYIHFQRKDAESNRYLRRQHAEKRKDLAISAGNAMVGWHKHKPRLAKHCNQPPAENLGLW